jgi:hypothetical protein
VILNLWISALSPHRRSFNDDLANFFGHAPALVERPRSESQVGDRFQFQSFPFPQIQLPDGRIFV